MIFGVIIIISVHNFFCFDIFFLVYIVVDLLIFCVLQLFKQHTPSSNNNGLFN